MSPSFTPPWRAIHVLVIASTAVAAPGCAAARAEAASAAEVAPAQAPSRHAPHAPAAAPAGAPAGTSQGAPAAGSATPESAEDSPAGMLVYEATVHVAVFEVQGALARAEAIARDASGHVLRRDDSSLVFRVPRASFDAALAAVAGVGDVLHRDVHAEDVTERHRDLSVRLRNARATRERLEQLLARAATVEDSLRIERELSRLAEEIERLSGELSGLGHRVAFSKITVTFSPRAEEPVREPTHQLPFAFLSQLGLTRLLDLSE